MSAPPTPTTTANSALPPSHSQARTETTDDLIDLSGDNSESLPHLESIACAVGMKVLENESPCPAHLPGPITVDMDLLGAARARAMRGWTSSLVPDCKLPSPQENNLLDTWDAIDVYDRNNHHMHHNFDESKMPHHAVKSSSKLNASALPFQVPLPPSPTTPTSTSSGSSLNANAKPFVSSSSPTHGPIDLPAVTSPTTVVSPTTRGELRATASPFVSTAMSTNTSNSSSSTRSSAIKITAPVEKSLSAPTRSIVATVATDPVAAPANSSFPSRPAPSALPITSRSDIDHFDPLSDYSPSYLRGFAYYNIVNQAVSTPIEKPLPPHAIPIIAPSSHEMSKKDKEKVHSQRKPSSTLEVNQKSPKMPLPAKYPLPPSPIEARDMLSASSQDDSATHKTGALVPAPAPGTPGVSFDAAATAPTLSQRRGKADIMSLYTSPKGPGALPTRLSPDASPLATAQPNRGGPSVSPPPQIEAQSNLRDSHFSFSFPTDIYRPYRPMTEYMETPPASPEKAPDSSAPVSAAGYLTSHSSLTVGVTTPLGPTNTPIFSPADDHPLFDLRGSEVVPFHTTANELEDLQMVNAPFNPTETRLDEAKAQITDLRELFQTLRDGNSYYQGIFSRFQGGMEEVIERLHMEVTNHQCFSPSHSNKPDFEAERLFHERIAHLTAANECLQNNARQTEATLSTLQADNQRIKDESEQLAQQYRLAQDEYAKLRQQLFEVSVDRDRYKAYNERISRKIDEARLTKRRLAALLGRYHALKEDSSIIPIFLDGNASMFHPSLIQQGENGGKRMARNVFDQVKLLYNLGGKGESSSSSFMLYLFLDMPAIVRGLQVSDGPCTLAQLRRFCDGFMSEDNLFCVVDTVQENLPERIQAMLKAYSSLTACKMAFLATAEASLYIPFLEQQDERVKSKIFFARSTPESEEDPFLRFGSDKLHHVSCLFPRVSGRPITPLTAAGHPPSRPLSRASLTTARPPSPLESEFTVQTQEQSVTRLSRPPWAEFRPARPQEASTVIADTQALIRRQAASVATTNTSRRGMNEVPPSPPSPPHHSHQPHEVGDLVIPWSRDDGSIGGSPPESDEDEPSVRLPHSAVKHVQRPIPIEEGGYDSESERLSVSSLSTARSPRIAMTTAGNQYLGFRQVSAGPSTQSAAQKQPLSLEDRISRNVSSPAASSQARGRAASASGSNKTPLGTSRFGSGPQPWSSSPHAERRHTPEYKVLSNLDPKPCHHHYLERNCPNGHACPFGHDYTLLPGEVILLRELAKEMASVHSPPEHQQWLM